MKVINPTTIQEAMLISSTATEAYASWSSSTTYAINAIVVYGTRLYKSLQNSNLNKLPSEVGSLWWSDIGPSNKFAMFDEQVNTTTTSTGSITVVLEPGSFDSLYLSNLKAQTVTLVVRNAAGGDIIYEETQSLSADEVFDWYQYFLFDPLNNRSQVLFTNIPPTSTAHVTLTITSGGTSSVYCGICVLGKMVSIGNTEYGVTSGIIDYSRKEPNEFGETVFVRRNFSKKIDARVWLKLKDLNRVQKLLYDLRATPVVWIGSSDPSYEEALIVYGFYRDFTTEISYPTTIFCSIQIEGLI